jgi:hypothetical protein
MVQNAKKRFYFMWPFFSFELFLALKGHAPLGVNFVNYIP